VSHVESPGCQEVLLEGELDAGSIAEFEGALDRAVDSDHLHLLVDLGRCEFIDVAAVKLLVVTQEHLSGRGGELVIPGATGQVRRMLELVNAFDRRVLPAAVDHAPEAPSGREHLSGSRPRLGAPRELGGIDTFGP
jgi:anti-anti-sigma factor